MKKNKLLLCGARVQRTFSNCISRACRVQSTRVGRITCCCCCLAPSTSNKLFVVYYSTAAVWTKGRKEKTKIDFDDFKDICWSTGRFINHLREKKGEKHLQFLLLKLPITQSESYISIRRRFLFFSYSCRFVPSFDVD
jgi:hypothetical protein